MSELTLTQWILKTLALIIMIASGLLIFYILLLHFFTACRKIDEIHAKLFPKDKP